MTKYQLKGGEAQLLADLHQNVDNFDNVDAVPQAGNNIAAKLSHQKGNPMLTGKGATYALQNYTFAFTVATGAFTRINYSALPSGSQGIMVFYSVNDFNNGYTKAKSLIQLPSSSFAYGDVMVKGRDYLTADVNGTLTALDATALALLQNGDVIIPTTIRSGGVDYVILSVQRCQQVPYASLLQAGVSNSFNQKGIRYILQDTNTATLAQFTNALYNFDLSSFGKFEQDSTDVNSNNQPDNFKANIIDVPLTMGIIKSSGIASAVTLNGISGNSLVINFSSFVSNAHNPQD